MSTDNELTELTELINAIPGEEGWWKSDGADTFADIAAQLVERGFTQTDAVDLLTSAYQAVSGEYE